MLAISDIDIYIILMLCYACLNAGISVKRVMHHLCRCRPWASTIGFDVSMVLIYMWIFLSQWTAVKWHKLKIFETSWLVVKQLRNPSFHPLTNLDRSSPILFAVLQLFVPLTEVVRRTSWFGTPIFAQTSPRICFPAATRQKCTLVCWIIPAMMRRRTRGNLFRWTRGPQPWTIVEAEWFLKGLRVDPLQNVSIIL